MYRNNGGEGPAPTEGEETPEKPKGSHCFIQWKGTDVCADVHCSCGNADHVDREFFYYWGCAKCGQVYEVDCYVRLKAIQDRKERERIIKAYNFPIPVLEFQETSVILYPSLKEVENGELAP